MRGAGFNLSPLGPGAAQVHGAARRGPAYEQVHALLARPRPAARVSGISAKLVVPLVQAWRRATSPHRCCRDRRSARRHCDGTASRNHNPRMRRCGRHAREAVLVSARGDCQRSYRSHARLGKRHANSRAAVRRPVGSGRGAGRKR